MGLYNNGSSSTAASRKLPLENDHESIALNFKRLKASGSDNFPQRKISATRDFPLGCGRNPQLSCERNNSEPRASEKTISRNEANNDRENVQYGYNSSGTMGINVKKHKLMEMGKSIPASNEKRHKTEYSKGLKVPPPGKVAYLDPGELVNIKHGKEYVNVIRGRETLKLFRDIVKEVENESKKQRGSTNRIDLLAWNRLKSRKMWVESWVESREAIVGSIPGVEVGDKFQYRVELSIVGLNRQSQAGIDYLMQGGKTIATSIVASGRYENDMYGPDVFVYCGQGGKPMNGDKRPKDQKLKRGNLALKNSIEVKNVVRVIFGSKEIIDPDSINPRGKKVSYFVYDGLYLVENYQRAMGRYGTSIFKFYLRRVPGQPELNLRKNSKELEAHRRICSVDISQGKGKMGIYAMNTVDGEKPSPFLKRSNRYNHRIGQANHSKGNIKKKICYRGSSNRIARRY